MEQQSLFSSQANIESARNAYKERAERCGLHYASH